MAHGRAPSGLALAGLEPLDVAMGPVSVSVGIAWRKQSADAMRLCFGRNAEYEPAAGQRS